MQKKIEDGRGPEAGNGGGGARGVFAMLTRSLLVLHAEMVWVPSSFT